MKGFRFAGIGVALLAVLALSAMAVASSASAAVTFLLALWLEGGSNVAENMLVETSGELQLENTNAPIIKSPAAVLCSGILDGFVGPNSADEVTEVLSLAGVAISSTALTGTSLACTLVTACESGKVWAVNLPWVTELELWVEGTEEGFVDLILPHAGGGNPGWYVECTILGIKSSEECTTPVGVAKQTNVATGVEGEFSEAFTLLMEQKNALCTGNNEETGVVSGKGITVNSLTPILAASE